MCVWWGVRVAGLVFGRVGVWMCRSCHVQHCVTEEMQREVPLRFMRYLVDREPEELYSIPKVARYCNRSLLRLKEHQLEVAPKHACSYRDEEGWVLSSKYPYPRYLCTICQKRRTRNVCGCNKQRWICQHCHPHHATRKALKVSR